MQIFFRSIRFVYMFLSLCFATRRLGDKIEQNQDMYMICFCVLTAVELDPTLFEQEKREHNFKNRNSVHTQLKRKYVVKQLKQKFGQSHT